jgi:group I intron endonuclease
MGFIYILTSPSGKSYIGQTIHRVGKRLSQHQLSSSECMAIRGAIEKYGWKNFVVDWYECPNEDLNFDEELLVREMGTLAPGGYNLKEGGGAHGKMSDISKQKMSESTKGEKNPMYGKTGKT